VERSPSPRRPAGESSERQSLQISERVDSAAGRAQLHDVTMESTPTSQKAVCGTVSSMANQFFKGGQPTALRRSQATNSDSRVGALLGTAEGTKSHLGAQQAPQGVSDAMRSRAAQLRKVKQYVRGLEGVLDEDDKENAWRTEGMLSSPDDASWAPRETPRPSSVTGRTTHVLKEAPTGRSSNSQERARSVERRASGIAAVKEMAAAAAQLAGHGSAPYGKGSQDCSSPYSGREISSHLGDVSSHLGGARLASPAVSNMVGVQNTVSAAAAALQRINLRNS